MSGRERNLMWGFGGALLIFGTIFMATVGSNWVKGLFSENDRLRERTTELRELIASRESWQQRDAWLDEKVPHFASRQEASSALLEAVEAMAGNGSEGVVLKSRQLSEPANDLDDDEGNDYFDASSMKMELEAPEAELYQWIHRLHNPDSFRGVTALTLERGEAGTLRAEVELTQFYLE